MARWVSLWSRRGQGSRVARGTKRAGFGGFHLFKKSLTLPYVTLPYLTLPSEGVFHCKNGWYSTGWIKIPGPPVHSLLRGHKQTLWGDLVATHVGGDHGDGDVSALLLT